MTDGRVVPSLALAAIVFEMNLQNYEWQTIQEDIKKKEKQHVALMEAHHPRRDPCSLEKRNFHKQRKGRKMKTSTNACMR
eukprot:CAMPEP_0201521442 /NCGR_PEP_ID=MMETSP0161_2-20130828/14423_1 /ASSEMBLY_ACC=CAM_ASM_000251 /TAXON_ID=180227 /ORGANISM="Neoparamoeba aestuarina, Strain SoJaBio B1-5/56/2" /LENGTH=79 /DNA_ID=CAMNT_0047920079 /DNA_START=35 /DNA_END=271 /DNA_ORIENTATION=-